MSRGALWLAALALLLLAWGVDCKKYNIAAKRDARHPLNVHIVPHTHDDSGWLKTVDQYYWGANNSIQVAGVQYILDSVMDALAANPDRKFIYAEMSFFTRWWSQQDDDVRALVTRLVEEGQLDFVNGGYVQHDEATAHYVAMIDQTTRGHQFLRSAFGVRPTVGWQIDPFGHSSTQAGLLSAQVGFDALFFGRADYQDMEYRKGIKALEMVWRGSGSLEDADVFAGNFPTGNYGPPPGFDYDWGSGAPPIMDDPRLKGYNVEERVEAFVQACLQVANVTQGNDIMLPFGMDFQYAAAHIAFKNIDKLIHYANADGRLNVFYSTPAEYVAAKHSYDQEWPSKTDDFFPYSDCPHCFWTGFFSSRPTSKALIRQATSFLQAARQLEAFMGINTSKGGATTDALEEAVALTQHHDAITGTEKQHVACDYAERLHSALGEAQSVVTNALSRLIRGKDSPRWLVTAGSRPPVGSEMPSKAAVEAALPKVLADEAEAGLPNGAAAEQRRRLLEQINPIDSPINLSFCNWLNISACRPSVRLSGAGQGLLVAAYNPLAWSRQLPLRVPVNSSATCCWKVTGPEGEALASQLLPVPDSTRALQQLMREVNATCPATYADAEVVFLAQLPPLGYSIFFLEPSSGCGEYSAGDTAVGGSSASAGCGPAAQHVAGSSRGSAEGEQAVRLHGMELPAGQEHVAPAELGRNNNKRKNGKAVLDNGLVALEFDSSTGLLTSMRTASGAAVDLVASFGWYNSSDGLNQEENRGQPSGAYIFRPNGFYDVSDINGTGAKRPEPVRLELVEGETVWEARQVFSDWATLITRLYKGQSHVELEWTVGPIPFEDGLGREIVLSYESGIDSGREFWTDANGREMIKRVRDYRPAWELEVKEPVAGNYYPLTAGMYIQDGKHQLAVLTDRAQGGASLRPGQMELMVHRRTLGEDARGVGEPINETACGCIQCSCTGLVARGVHWLVLDSAEEAARARRSLQQQLNDPALLAFGPIPRHVGHHSSSEEAEEAGRGASPLQEVGGGGGIVGLRRQFSLSEGHILPSSVHLLTLKDTGEQSFLVRLAHLYQEGEDPGLSKPIKVNLNAVLQYLQYYEVRELSLSANQLRSRVRRRRFKAGPALSPDDSSSTASTSSEAKGEGQDNTDEPIHCVGPDCANGQLLVRLRPMEVRTFELVFRPQ